MNKKLRTAAAALAAVMALSCASVPAFADDQEITVKLPFEFVGSSAILFIQPQSKKEPLETVRHAPTKAKTAVYIK